MTASNRARDEAIRTRLLAGEEALVLTLEYGLKVSSIYGVSKRVLARLRREAAAALVPAIDRRWLHKDRRSDPAHPAMAELGSDVARGRRSPGGGPRGAPCRRRPEVTDRQPRRPASSQRLQRRCWQ